MAGNFQMITRLRSPITIVSMRGTSGDLGHPRQSRYRCSLPGLAGFAGPRCTEPEVPRSGSRSLRLLKKILTQRHGGNQRVQPKTAVSDFRNFPTACKEQLSFQADTYCFGFAGTFAGAAGGTTSAGFTQFTLNGPVAFTWTIVSVLLRAKWR